MTGEERHERCRYGRLAPAWGVVDAGVLEPTSIPLCSWRPTGPFPPAVTRAWGGHVYPERDCAVCQAWTDDLSERPE